MFGLIFTHTASRIVHCMVPHWCVMPVHECAHTHTQNNMPASNARGGQYLSHLCFICPMNHNHHADGGSLQANKWGEEPNHLVKCNKEDAKEADFLLSNNCLCSWHSSRNLNILLS